MCSFKPGTFWFCALTIISFLQVIRGTWVLTLRIKPPHPFFLSFTPQVSGLGLSHWVYFSSWPSLPVLAHHQRLHICRSKTPPLDFCPHPVAIWVPSPSTTIVAAGPLVTPVWLGSMCLTAAKAPFPIVRQTGPWPWLHRQSPFHAVLLWFFSGLAVTHIYVKMCGPQVSQSCQTFLRADFGFNQALWVNYGLPWGVSSDLGF